MIIVKTNKWLFLLKLFSIPLGIALICLGYINEFYFSDSEMPFAIFLLVVFLGCFAFLISIISFFGIIKVSIDISSSKMNLIGLFTSREVLINNITEYYKTETIGKWGIYNSVLIKLDDGSIFELTELNLTSIDEIENLLIEFNIKCLGKKKSYYPLTRKF